MLLSACSLLLLLLAVSCEGWIVRDLTLGVPELINYNAQFLNCALGLIIFSQK
jgi:hypothetical protein